MAKLIEKQFGIRSLIGSGKMYYMWCKFLQLKGHFWGCLAD